MVSDMKWAKDLFMQCYRPLPCLMLEEAIPLCSILLKLDVNKSNFQCNMKLSVFVVEMYHVLTGGIMRSVSLLLQYFLKPTIEKLMRIFWNVFGCFNATWRQTISASKMILRIIKWPKSVKILIWKWNF